MAENEKEPLSDVHSSSSQHTNSQRNKQDQHHDSNPNQHADHPHHLHLPGRRLRQLLRPDGRRIHIAVSPDELDHLQRQASQRSDGEEYEYILVNSAEHVEALREIHSHYEDRREGLRGRHPDVFEEFESVIRQLETLATELHLVSHHAIQLDANFSKYGYSATIRTRESHGHGHGHGSSSSATSTHGDATPRSQADWDAERSQTASLKFWVAPVVRQYFHKGLLWRASETHEVASYELFTDLLYVGIVAITGDAAAGEGTGEAILRFAITFTQAWKFWLDLNNWTAVFDADDIVRRLSVLFLLATLLGFTTNMVDFFGPTYTPAVAFYLAGRLFTIANYIWYIFIIPMIRPELIVQMTIALMPVGLWIGSIHVTGGARLALIWVALFLDVFGNTLKGFVNMALTKSSKRLSKWLEKTFEFRPGTSIEHRIERMGSFVTLIFGYSVVSVLYQNQSHIGINSFLGKAILGLIQAFAFNTLYFEADFFNMHVHAIRRSWQTNTIWLFIHLPFTMAFTIAGAALSRLVLAHDCPDANPDSLVDEYAAKSLAQINNGLRWFYCAGLGIALFCTGVISLTHTYKRPANLQWSKSMRQGLRFVISVIIVMLGFAKSLNSLELIGTTTALLCVILGVEAACDIAADGRPCSFREMLSRFVKSDRKCRYNARCSMSRRHLVQSVKDGRTITIEEIKDAEKAGFDSALS